MRARLYEEVALMVRGHGYVQIRSEFLFKKHPTARRCVLYIHYKKSTHKCTNSKHHQHPNYKKNVLPLEIFI